MSKMDKCLILIYVFSSLNDEKDDDSDDDGDDE